MAKRRIAFPIALLLALGLAAGAGAQQRTSKPASAPGRDAAKAVAPTAIVLMIGDGMGPSQVSFARALLLEPGERFGFERLPVAGWVSTYSASNQVTDSGAAATAFASGVKTINQVIGVDTRGRGLRSLSELAKSKGWKVGYVTNTTITHATPAAFYAGVGDRYEDVDRIAQQLIEHRPDVALGGGELDFLPDWLAGKQKGNLNLLDQARAGGFTVWTEVTEIAPSPRQPLLGLFTNSHLPYELDRQALPPGERPPTLEQMTGIALEVLSRDGKPFFLMVEGGRIDHAAHGFDAAGTALETASFDRAVDVVRGFQQAHPGTLLVITADHATGGLAINDYVDWSAFGGQKASLDTIARAARSLAAPIDAVEVGRLAGVMDYADEELQALRDATDTYEATRILGTQLGRRNGITWIPKVNEADTKGHTGEDVPIYASGPGAERFGGTLDNTDIPKRMAALLGWGAELPALDPLPAGAATEATAP